MKIRRVVPNIRGTRMPESRAFYVDVIGLELAMDLGWIMSFSSKDNPTAQLSVLTKDATAPTHPDVSIEVDDLDAVHARAAPRSSTRRPSSRGECVGSSFAIRTER